MRAINDGKSMKNSTTLDVETNFSSPVPSKPSFFSPLLLLHTTASFVSDVYRNMLKYVNYAKVIYKAILIAMGEGGILLAEKSNKTNTSEEQKKKKVQTQHA